MNQHHQPRAKICAGSKQTPSEASYLYVNEVFSRPEFMVLGVGNHHPQGRGQRFGAVLKPHVHFVDLSNQQDGFETPEGDQAMTTTTPTLGNTTTLADALRQILSEVTPGQRPFSSDSFLPEHLIELAQRALDQQQQIDMATSQHAFNALSVAGWHVARGELPQALARMRRAQSHIKSALEGGAV